jgi:hypothetical protein
MQMPIIDNMHKPKPMMLPVFKNNFSQRRELGGKLLVNCDCGGFDGGWAVTLGSTGMSK